MIRAIVALAFTVLLWCGAQAQFSYGPNYGSGFGFKAPAVSGGGPSFSITYESTAVNTSSGSSNNFGTVSWGPSPSVALAILCYFQSPAPTITSFTMGGASASQVSGIKATGGAATIDAWYAVAPSGSSGNVTVNYSANLGGGQSVLSLFNIQTTTTTPSSGTNNSSGNSSSLTQSITVPSGGGGVAGLCNQAFSSQTFSSWTNATNSNTQTGNVSMSVGKVTGTGSISVTGTLSASDAVAMGLVSWAP